MESNFSLCLLCVLSLFKPTHPLLLLPQTYHQSIVRFSCKFGSYWQLPLVCAQFDAFLSFMSEFLKILLLTISFTRVVY